MAETKLRHLSTIHRAYRYRLYPTPDQAERLAQFAGAARFVYNLALEQRRDWWRQYRAAGRCISFPSQSAELTDLRAEVPWLAEICRTLLEQALRDLDAAYAAFFAGHAGYPAFRNRSQHSGFRVKGIECRIKPLNRKWALVRLPKCEPMKFRLTRPIVGTIKNVTVKLEAGRWFVSFATEREHEAPANDLPAVGIDRGIANTLSLSTGEHFRMPDMGSVMRKRKRKRAQKALARCVKGSARRKVAKLRVARHSAKIAAIRKHWLHERSTDIARRFGAVTMEALRIADMTRSGTGKRGLNRSILEQGWGELARQLEYKLAERGGSVSYVNPAYTSQTCSECGSVARESRKSQAVFECVDCGHRAHADTNAAINIHRRSPAGVEGAGCGPVEARTINLAA
jgi:putative transposase